MSSLNQDHKWVPTHVQVTVLRGRGLRGKGKHGTSDVYTIIQLGKEKYSTCVVEKTTEPEWREECSFELPPGVLESELVLTVMHRAVMGLDVFLGQALIQLEKIYHESRCVKNEWYRLNSKTGKKEKERGNIQVTVQFTRNDLTASMYDLVMKDKSSTFGKLKERIKGKKRATEEDSSSGVLPGGYGSLHRMRQRLPSDGGGEEDYEDDEGGEARRSKMRTFFLRGKLRKSSDTRSSTSLGSESSESSSRGGSLSPTAGISVVVSDLSNSPSNSSNLTADNSPEHIEDPSSLHCEFGDDTSEITIVVPELPLCVNGSHVDRVPPVDPGSGVLQGSLGLGLLQKSLPTSTSLQNLSPISLADLPKGAAGDGRRWSFDKPDDEEKAAIAAALQRQEEEASARHNPQLRIPSYSSTKETKNQQEENSESNSTYRGWFGSKDGKRSLVESPKLGRSCEPPPFGHTVDLVTPLHHTNPFCNSQATPPPLSSCNPFFPFLQQNPFYEDINSTQPLNPALPPLPLLSSARPPITQLFPQASSTSPALTAVSLNVQPSLGFDAAGHEASPEEEKQVSNLWDQFVKEPEPDLDESFDMFAAGRLHSPEDTRLGREEKTTTGVEPTTHQNMNPFVNGVPDSSAGTFKHIDLFAFGLDTIPEDESFENNETMNSPVEVNTKGSTNTWTNTNKLSSRSPDPTSSGLGSSSEEDFLSCNSSYLASDKVSPCSSDEAIDSHGSAPESAVIRPVNKSESEETAEGSHEWAIQSSDVDEASGASLLTQTSVFTEASGAGLSVNSSVESSLPEPPVSSEPHAQQDSSILPTFDDVEQKRSSPQLLDCQGSPEAPDVDLFPNSPSLFITTSSPDAQHQDSPFESTTVGTLDISSHVMFDLLEFPAAVDTSLLHTQTSERSSAPQSLNVSTDSQRFHSCHSNPFTSSFDMQELNSADSTLRGESSEIVAATDFGLEDTMNPRGTSTGEVNQSESSDAAVDQKETSQPSMTNAPQGPASPGNSSGATGTESTDDKPLEVQDDLWATPTGEVQPSEGSGAVVDSKETSQPSMTNAPQGPASPGNSSGATGTESTDDKPLEVQDDLWATPTGEVQPSEGSGAVVDSKETSQPSMTNAPQGPASPGNSSGATGTESTDDKPLEVQDDLWATPTGEVQPSEGSGAVVDSKETSQPSMTNAPQGPASPGNSSGATGTESTDDKPLEVQDDLWGTPTGEVQPSEGSGAVVDSQETSFKITDDLATQDPAAWTSFGDSLTDSVVEQPACDKDLERSPSGDTQHSEGKTVDQTETLEPSLKITNDLFPPEPSPTSNVSDSSLTKSVVDVRDDDLWGTSAGEVHQSDGVGVAMAQTNTSDPSYAFTSDPFPLDPAAWSSSTGPLFTESVVENPWGVLDPWADAMEQKQTSQPSFITISDIISLEPVSTSSGGARTESGLADPWAFRVDDPWTVPAGEIQRSVSVGLAVDRPSAILTNDLFPQDFTATSTNLSDWTDSGVETHWGDTGRGRHRSQSVGAPSSTFNKERPPLSERDSVMLQESYSSQPDLSTFTSSAPSFIPEHGSFSLPPHSNTSARSPDTVGTAAPALASAQPFLQEVEPLQQEANQQTSPHPVKPLTSATPAEEKRSEGRSVLEKLKSTISPGKNSHASEQEAERRKSLTGGAGSYYHLTHSELVALLVRREAELERQKLQFQQQKTLLAKREMELRRLKPQVRDLEDYIDTLLVRIMEQKPTLLQVRTRLK